MSSFPAHWTSTVNSETLKTSHSFVLRMYFWMCHLNEKFPFSSFIFSYTIALKLYSTVRLNVLQCYPECMVFSVSYTFFLVMFCFHPSASTPVATLFLVILYFSLHPLINLSFHPIKCTFRLQSWPTETCYYLKVQFKTLFTVEGQRWSNQSFPVAWFQLWQTHHSEALMHFSGVCNLIFSHAQGWFESFLASQTEITDFKSRTTIIDITCDGELVANMQYLRKRYH